MKPKILVFVDSFNLGGSERQAVQLVRLLHETGRYQVHVACLKNRGVLREEAERLKLGDMPEFPLTSFHDWSAVVQLRRFVSWLRVHEIDVVHTHDFYSNIFGMIGAALAPVRVRIASRRESAHRGRIRRWVERLSCSRAQVIVSNCEEVRRQLIKEGLCANRVITIHNGMDLSRVTPAAGLRREEVLSELHLGCARDRRLVTIVANLHSVKDHPTFLRAARRVHAAIPEAGFVIAGEGERETSLRALVARLGLERDTFFLGRCERIAELLAISDVCVLSSASEGFSNAILEYMGAARPVVVTDVGGVREAVLDGETGYVVPVGDDEGMAVRIIMLLRDPERARAMGAGGRRVVEERFSPQAQSIRTQNLYDRLLAAAPAAQWRAIGRVRPEDG